MKSFLSVTVLALLLCYGAGAQRIASYDADALMARATGSDTTYIINFWATWCVPCVKELPEFNTLQQRFAGEKVKVLLVSFDFEDAYPKKLQAFIQKKKLLPEVAWFRETDANAFIPKIDDAWSGALPATLIMNKGADFKRLVERPVTADEISGIVAGIGK